MYNIHHICIVKYVPIIQDTSAVKAEWAYVYNVYSIYQYLPKKLNNKNFSLKVRSRN